jgi:hypothetical protein
MGKRYQHARWAVLGIALIVMAGTWVFVSMAAVGMFCVGWELGSLYVWLVWRGRIAG